MNRIESGNFFPSTLNSTLSCTLYTSFACNFSRLLLCCTMFTVHSLSSSAVHSSLLHCHASLKCCSTCSSLKEKKNASRNDFRYVALEENPFFQLGGKLMTFHFSSSSNFHSCAQLFRFTLFRQSIIFDIQFHNKIDETFPFNSITISLVHAESFSSFSLEREIGVT